MKQKTPKKIIFDEYDMEHLYEMAITTLYSCKNCFECEHLILRIEKFLGERTVKEIKKIIKKYPYK